MYMLRGTEGVEEKSEGHVVFCHSETTPRARHEGTNARLPQFPRLDETFKAAKVVFGSHADGLSELAAKLQGSRGVGVDVDIERVQREGVRGHRALPVEAPLVVLLAGLDAELHLVDVVADTQAVGSGEGLSRCGALWVCSAALLSTVRGPGEKNASVASGGPIIFATPDP